MLIDIPATLARTRTAISSLGGEVAVFEIGPPATPAHVDAVEKDIGRAIPSSMRRLFLEQSACLRMFWTLEGGKRLPKLLGVDLAGSIDLSLADLPTDQVRLLDV